MKRTLSREIGQAVRDANSPTVKKNISADNIRLGLGLRVLEAAGTSEGKRTTGCTPIGEPITKRGRVTFGVRMVDLASEALLIIRENMEGDIPGFTERRNRVAVVLGRALLD